MAARFQDDTGRTPNGPEREHGYLTRFGSVRFGQCPRQLVSSEQRAAPAIWFVTQILGNVPAGSRASIEADGPPMCGQSRRPVVLAGLMIRP